MGDEKVSWNKSADGHEVWTTLGCPKIDEIVAIINTGVGSPLARLEGPKLGHTYRLTIKTEDTSNP